LRTLHVSLKDGTWLRFSNARSIESKVPEIYFVFDEEHNEMGGFAVSALNHYKWEHGEEAAD
jgi:hypothetical protein